MSNEKYMLLAIKIKIMVRVLNKSESNDINVPLGIC